jgi:hypothetical protein
LDAKLNFDDNALFRHKDIMELRDLEEEDPKEIEASKLSLASNAKTSPSPVVTSGLISTIEQSFSMNTL